MTAKVTERPIMKTAHQEVLTIEIPSQATFVPPIAKGTEDVFLVLKGKGQVSIETTVSREVGPLTLIHAAGKAHQVFNDQKKTLHLLWMRASDIVEQKEYGDVYFRGKEGCFEYIPENNKYEKIYEFFGVNNGSAKQQSVALVEIAPKGSSDKHYHPVVEESYIITEGEAKLIIDNQESKAIAGEAVIIPVGKLHQIFNIGEKALQFIAIVTPPWTPDCGVYT